MYEIIPLILKEGQQQNPPHTDNRTPNELDAPFTIHELNNGINSSNSGSSPGLHQIQMLMNVPKNFRELLLTTPNEIITKNKYPIEWNEVLMILLTKKNQRVNFAL